MSQWVNLRLHRHVDGRGMLGHHLTSLRRGPANADTRWPSAARPPSPSARIRTHLDEQILVCHTLTRTDVGRGFESDRRGVVSASTAHRLVATHAAAQPN